MVNTWTSTTASSQSHKHYEELACIHFQQSCCRKCRVPPQVHRSTSKMGHSGLILRFHTFEFATLTPPLPRHDRLDTTTHHADLKKYFFADDANVRKLYEASPNLHTHGSTLDPHSHGQPWRVLRRKRFFRLGRSRLSPKSRRLDQPGRSSSFCSNPF